MKKEASNNEYTDEYRFDNTPVKNPLNSDGMDS